MNRRRAYLPFLLVVSLSSLLPGLHAQETITAKQAASMTRTAHTAEEYSKLSRYFRTQGEQFQTWAEQQRDEMKKALNQAGSSRYPSAYDRARNLHLYYDARAQQALRTAKQFEERARTATAEALAKKTESHP